MLHAEVAHVAERHRFTGRLFRFDHAGEPIGQHCCALY
jgi:hypothetical protein